MASSTSSWAPGTLVRFGTLDFVVTLNGGLKRVLSSIDLDDITETFRVLRTPSGGLYAPTPLRPGEPTYE